MLIGHRIAESIPKASDNYDAEVEYIESHGLEYIDTGVSITSETGFEIVAETNDRDTNCPVIIGGQKTDLTAYIGVWVDAAQAISTHICIGDEAVFLQGCDYNEKFKCSYLFNNIKEVKLQDNTTAFSNTSSLTPNTRNLYVFAACGDNGAETFCKAKIYRIRITEGGVLIRDFIPVRVGDNGALYDRINGKLYKNKGTGKITYGTDKVKPYDYLVDWIKSDGVSYVNIPTSKTAISAKTLNVEETIIEANLKRESGVSLQHFFSIYPINMFRCAVTVYSTTIANMGVFQLAGKNLTFTTTEKGVLEVNDVIITASTDENNIHIKLSKTDGTVIKESTLARLTSTLQSTPDNLTLLAYYNKTNTPPIYTQFMTHTEVKHIKIRSTSLGIDVDLYPCVKDGVAYLYDAVSETLYGNSAESGRLLCSGKKDVPYDYLVDYIEGDGIAFVDTGVNFGSTTKTNARFKIETNASFVENEIASARLFGFGSNVIIIYSLAKAWVSGTGHNYTYYCGNTTKRTMQTTVEADVMHTFSLEKTSGTEYIGKVDSEVLEIVGTESTSTTHPDVCCVIFGRCYGVTTSTNVTKTVYETSVGIRCRTFYVKNCLTGQEFDGVACVKDGIGYMYDRITGKLFGNIAKDTSGNPIGEFLFGDRRS